jgi:hypothetical protein
MVYLPDTNVRGFFRVIHDGDPSDRKISIAQERLRLDVANKIVDLKMRVAYKENHTEYSLDLYVLTPDELAGLIKKEAERLAYMLCRYSPKRDN